MTRSVTPNPSRSTGSAADPATTLSRRASRTSSPPTARRGTASSKPGELTGAMAGGGATVERPAASPPLGREGTQVADRAKGTRNARENRAIRKSPDDQEEPPRADGAGDPGCSGRDGLGERAGDDGRNLHP